MAKKEISGDRVGFGNYFGTAMMCLTNCIAASLMTSWFMQYLTDYAGLGTFGAVMGTVLLFVMRIFDAVNDPLEGWIMDKAKVGKHGKYKPFIIISIICESVGLAALFFIPGSIVTKPALVVIWVILAYLIYDIGASFYAPTLVYRTLTLDTAKRGKLMIAPRMLNMIIGMVCGSIISIVNGVNANIGNMHTAFGVTVLAGTVVCMVLSLIGVIFVKEKYHSPYHEGERVKASDIFTLFKENGAMRVKFLATIASGFIWTFLFSTMLYYVKWGYCADLTTGEVDAATYGTLSLIGSMMMLLPLLVGTVLAMPLLKVFKTPVRLEKFCILLQGIPCGILFILQMLGVLQNSPAIFLTMVAIAATAIGIAFIPQETINIEAMDYEIYKNGKDRSGLVNAAAKFLDKAQSAVSSGMIGIILVAVGYTVDSSTDTYVGELSRIPSLLNWFIVLMGLVPCILAVISYFIYGKYPITAEIAADMREKLKSQNDMHTEQ